MESITKSFEYNTLDHKWLARDYLQRHMNRKKELPDRPRENVRYDQQRPDGTTDSAPKEDPLLLTLNSLAISSFNYYRDHIDVFRTDPSLQAVTALCSEIDHSHRVDGLDVEVFRLSHTFNQIIESNRKMLKCYDCGTNDRAMFLKLIDTHRGLPFISNEEQVRMKEQYRVTYAEPVAEALRCKEALLATSSDTVFIISLSIQSFGHVWIIEKRFVRPDHAPHNTPPVPRYHHYQSSLRSHLVLDFIESKDYGRDLHQSLDIEQFFGGLVGLLGRTEAWDDAQYRTFCNLFAFHPVSIVNDPKPGFCYTYVTY